MSLSTTFYTVFSKKSDRWLFGHFFSSLHTHTCTHACVHTHTHPPTKNFNGFPGEKTSLFQSLHRWENFSCLPLFLSHSLHWLLTWEYRKKPLCITSLIRYSPVSFYQHSKYLLLFSSLRFLLLWLFGMD